MNMKKMTMTVAALVIALPLSATVLAGGRGDCGDGYGDGPGPRGDAMMGPMMRDLDLSDEQRDQIRTLMQGQRAQRQQNWEQRSEYRQQMHQLLMADQFDEAAAKKLIESQSAQHEQQMLERLKLHHQVLSVLTPEQKAEYQQKMENWEPGYHHHGKGHGKGPGKGSN